MSEFIEQANPIKLAQDTEALKIYKLARGYNWEFKLIGILDSKLIERAKELRDIIDLEFPSKQE